MNINLQPLAVPAQLAGTDGELRCLTLHAATAALGHGPAALAAVQSDVQCAMIFRVAVTARKGAAVVR
jgi:hypothetical protein